MDRGTRGKRYRKQGDREQEDRRQGARETGHREGGGWGRGQLIGGLGALGQESQGDRNQDISRSGGERRRVGQEVRGEGQNDKP
jgi:hypothetical protein